VSSTAEVLGRTLVHAAFVVAEIIALGVSFRLAQAQAAALDLRAAEADSSNRALDERNRALDGSLARLDTVVSSSRALAGEVRAEAVAVSSTGSDVLAGVLGTEAAAERSATAVVDAGQVAEAIAERAQGTVQEAEQDVEQRIDAIAGRVVSLTERTEEISTIVATVRELADQSNLLALNASIEAARAGEHGRGFAVVAEHVRRLAERSSGATADVDELLRGIDRAAEAAVSAARDGGESVVRGRDAVGQAGGALNDAGRAGAAVEDSARRIAEAVASNRGGAERIAAAMTDARTAIEAVVTSAADGRTAAERLQELAVALEQVTSRLEGVGAELEGTPPSATELARV
jgi:methyl-accepting chemotaxis protein